MKLRIGTVAAFGVGYVLGSRAGRERYTQLVRLAGRARRSAPVTTTVGTVGEKARAAASLGVERTRDAISTRMGWRDADEAVDALAQDLAGEVASALNAHRR